MPRDSNVPNRDSDPNEPDVNVDEDPLPQWRKGKLQLRRSLNACFDVGATSAPSNIRSKDKEGPSTARRALAGRIRRDPLWLDRSNLAELISRNR